VNDLAAGGDVEHAKMAWAAEHGIFHIDIESVPRDIDVVEISRSAFGMQAVAQSGRAALAALGQLDDANGDVVSLALARLGDTQSAANVANVLDSPPAVLPLERVYV
jgi:hypothetical protein